MIEEKRIALITGGSRGIGKAIALKLANSGFDIWLNYLSNHAAAEETANEIRKIGSKCELLPFDVGNRHAASTILDEKLKNETPYCIVYNSGIIRDNLMVFMSEDEWDSVINTNLNGFYNVIKPPLLQMMASKKGRIVVISSTSGQIGRAGQVNYSATKAGLIGAAKALAREVGKKNIYVNVVAPGVIETEMTEKIPKNQVLPLIPLNRFGKVEEVASLVNYLCSEDSMYIHGQVIGVNGGLAM